MIKIVAGLGLAVALGAVGCGGSQKNSDVGGGLPATSAASATQPATESACVVMAANVAAQLKVTAAGQGAETEKMAAQIGPLMEKVTSERCQADAWSAEAVDCMTMADAAGLEACAAKLTPAQTEAVEAAMKDALGDDFGGSQKPEGAGSPPPPPDDPCGGGA